MRPIFPSLPAFLTLATMLMVSGSVLGQTTSTFDWTPGTTVPDNNPVGIANTQTITFNSAAVITGLEVRLNLTGGWNGDLYASLVHDSGFTVLLNRVGNTGSNPAGSGSSGMNITFSDSATTDIHTGISGSGFITGVWQPDARTADPAVVTDLSSRTAFLSSFNEAPVQGNWTLFLADDAASDTSVLTGWGLTITSEERAFAIWDANGNASGVGGAGTWSSTGSTWATSAVGTSTSAQTATAQLVFEGTGGVVTLDGVVSPAAGLRFKTDGYRLTGGTLELNGASQANNMIVVDENLSATIDSIVYANNDLGMIKSGAGVLVLTGGNNYNGLTGVNEGFLYIDGNQTAANGAVTVASGATLGGIGTIGGATTVQSGGFLTGATDGTVGTIHFASDLTTNTGSIWLIDLVQNVNGVSDRINVTGDLYLDSSTLSLITSGAFTLGNTYTIATYASRVGTFSNLAEGAFVSGYQINYGDNAITLTAVPEPGTLGLLGLALGGFIFRRLRLRQRVVRSEDGQG